MTDKDLYDVFSDALDLELINIEKRKKCRRKGGLQYVMVKERLLVDFMKWLEKTQGISIGNYTFKARYFLKQKRDIERIKRRMKVVPYD